VTPQAPPPTPVKLAQRLGELRGIQRRLHQEQTRDQVELAAVKARIELYPKVAAALQSLSEKLFQELLGTLEQKLTIALQEVLGQPLTFHAEASADQRSGVTVELKLKMAGKDVSIMDGSGGSVANVLSVGLRLFALASLDPAKHARVLILDEPDCWLRPDLVPRLAKIIADAGRALGFQVILISHHDINVFRPLADRIIQLEPSASGVIVRHIDPHHPADPGES